MHYEGIDNISAQDIDYGKQLELVLKPLSVGMSKDNKFTLGSFPAFVKENHYWLRFTMKVMLY